MLFFKCLVYHPNANDLLNTYKVIWISLDIFDQYITYNIFKIRILHNLKTFKKKLLKCSIIQEFLIYFNIIEKFKTPKWMIKSFFLLLYFIQLSYVK